jgi:transcriptional regulator with GAF, ATPase, and Fis domain/tetratricopeptide (TPR) repeat protein
MAAPSLSLHPLAHGFVELDDRILAASSGVVVVVAPTVEVVDAAGAHVARRAMVRGPTLLHAEPRPGSPVFRDVLAALGLPCSCSVDESAAELAQVAATLVLSFPANGTWDRAVLQALIRLLGTPPAAPASLGGYPDRPQGPLVVLLCTPSDGYAQLAHASSLSPQTPQATQSLQGRAAANRDSGPNGAGAAEMEIEVYEVSDKMTAEARRRWFVAVAERACVDAGVEDLATLDSSFAGLSQIPVPSPRAGSGLSALQAGAAGVGGAPAAEALLVSLALVGRPWPIHELASLSTGDAAALASLREVGAVLVARGLVSIDPSWQGEAESLGAKGERGVLLAAAELLRGRFGEDAWARARRAELLLRGGEFESADVAFASAVACAKDPLARRELVERWSTLLAETSPEQRLALAVKAAERALAAGRAEEGHHWAEVAAAVGGDDPLVALLFGRASVATGDLVAASIAFERGAAQTTDRETLLLFQVENAETAYLRGALDEAAERAQRVIDQATESTGVVARLEARNTLGKILLARAAWDEADRHFEEDAWLASSSGLASAELRARSNRAITLLSRGLMDKARALFEAVLQESERKGEIRASAFALDNLAVVASHQHQYAACLELWERAFKLRQELGDRAALTHIFRNLAYIRAKLGLWEHAEHAIAFGRATLGPGTPVASSAYFALCAARVALLRGRTMQARREVLSAIPESRVSGDARCLAEAQRLLARIELDEGNLVRAREAIDRVRESPVTAEGRAELCLLEATLARAQGELDPELALHALSVARLADDEQILIETQTLLSEIYRAAGDFDLARRHFDQGLALRDQVVSGLPEEIRPAYLSRPDSQALDRAGAMLREPQMRESLRESMRDSMRDGGAPWSASGFAGGEGPQSSSGLPSLRDVAGVAAGRILVGEDPGIRALLSAVRKVAVASCTVLIRGESGTGKELVAQAIHACSDRAAGPMVTVNCAALVETLLLSELFGHEKGAFTGAAARRRGRFELAEGGTLFLDEIGDISARTQVALLRVLQERTFERVGGAAPIRVDVRILCATHRDLKSMVERGEFRQDLYYRLRGVTLDVPPLRMRMNDLPIIGEHLLGRIARERDETQKSLSPDALDLLSRHRWPGNVRELENALRAASLFAEGAVITADDLVLNVDELRMLAEARMPNSMASMDPACDGPGAAFWGDGSGPVSSRTGPPSTRLGKRDPNRKDASEMATTVAYAQVRGGASSLSDIKRQIERDCIARALAETKGNITRAAVLLGMKRPRLSQLVKHYGLLAASSEAS